MVRIRSGLWLLLGKKEKNTLFGRALVRVGAIIEKNTLFGRAFVRIWSKIEKNTLCGKAFG